MANLAQRLSELRSEAARLEREILQCLHVWRHTPMTESTIKEEIRDYWSGAPYDVRKKVMQEQRECQHCGIVQFRHFENGWSAWE